MKFNCTECGACCRQLVKEYAPELDRGDGICKHLDGNRCSIYDTRPKECRVDKMYEQRLLSGETNLGREEYYNVVHFLCNELQKAEVN